MPPVPYCECWRSGSGLDGVIGDGDGATHPVVSGDVADVAIHAWSQLDSDTTRRTPGISTSVPVSSISNV